jgi:hypothetical protein
MIEAALIAEFVVRGRLGGAVAGSLNAERAAFHDRAARGRAVHAARTRWLRAHRAEVSFPCGVVPTDDVGFPPEVRDRRAELAVVVAVLPDAVSFLVDPPEMFPSPEPVEAGSVPRDALAGAEVCDLAGAPVPEPAAESFEPEPDVVLVVSWFDGDETREQRLLFRSAWLAWSAARRLRQAFVPGT